MFVRFGCPAKATNGIFTLVPIVQSYGPHLNRAFSCFGRPIVNIHLLPCSAIVGRKYARRARNGGKFLKLLLLPAFHLLDYSTGNNNN